MHHKGCTPWESLHAKGVLLRGEESEVRKRKRTPTYLTARAVGERKGAVEFP